MNDKPWAGAGFAALLGVFSASCSTVDNRDDLQPSAHSQALQRFDQQAHDRIASNFVSTLAQLQPLPPIHTTIQMIQPTTPFGQAVEHHIIETGYGHQLVNGDMGRYFLRYRVADVNDQYHLSRTYYLQVGDIVLERDYRKIGSHLTPVSAMRIGGAGIEGVELQDDIFRFNNPHEFTSAVEVLKYYKSLPPLMASSTTRSAISRQPGVQTRAAARPANKIIEKIPANGLSNYEDVFSDYRDVHALKLPFANGSFKISFVNWERMEKLVDQFDPERDLFSVIACSSEQSAQGDPRLAQRRAERFRKALVRAKIPVQKIYTESCWGNEYARYGYPARGFIMALKRRNQ